MKAIACLIFPNFQSLDVCGPLDVFAECNALLGPGEGYRIYTIAENRNAVTASNGLKIYPDYTINDHHPNFDTVIIAGGPHVPTCFDDESVLNWLPRIMANVRRCCSICTGAFILGQAGLLEGLQATTHWLHTNRFRELFPNTKLLPDRIYVRSGKIFTSAGVTAGIDLSLALARDDYGAELALKVAKRLLVVAHRQGGQSQFSPLLTPLLSEDSALQQAIDYIHKNISHRMNAAELAAAAHMSKRSFNRDFFKQIGITPTDYIERYRVEIAKIRLESSGKKIKEIAYDCGFGSTENMRLAFVRRVCLSPSHYRHVFAMTDGITSNS